MSKFSQLSVPKILILFFFSEEDAITEFLKVAALHSFFARNNTICIHLYIYMESKVPKYEYHEIRERKVKTLTRN